MQGKFQNKLDVKPMKCLFMCLMGEGYLNLWIDDSQTETFIIRLL